MRENEPKLADVYREVRKWKVVWSLKEWQQTETRFPPKPVKPVPAVRRAAR